MAIQELLAVVQAPETPLEPGDKIKWTTIQNKLGLPLPRDLYDFAMAFGTGSFGGPYELKVFNPFSSKYSGILEAKIDALKGSQPYNAALDQPYGLFPTQPGLFPIGTDAGGYDLYWFTLGDPDQWPIVVTVAREEYIGEFHEMSMTTFLAKAFKHEIQEPFRYDPFEDLDPAHVGFYPTPS